MAERSMKASVPPYMQQGSKGGAVSLLQAFLCGQGLGEGIVFDGEYGGITSSAVRRFQHKYALEIDGNFGPGTRATAKSNGFDFEAACETLKLGASEFIQPDGKIHYY